MVHWSDGMQWQRALHRLYEGTARFDVVAHTSLLSACAKNSKWARALWHFFQEMSRDKVAPDLICIGAALSACARGGRWELALQMLRGEGEGAAKPLKKVNAAVVGAALSACAKAAQWEVACLLLLESSASSVKPDVVSFNVAINAIL